MPNPTNYILINGCSESQIDLLGKFAYIPKTDCAASSPRRRVDQIRSRPFRASSAVLLKTAADTCAELSRDEN
jgi:hypothetical protein